MGGVGYVTLALSIALNAALIAGIVLVALGAGLVAAVTSGGGAFVAVTGLVLGIFHFASKKP